MGNDGGFKRRTLHVTNLISSAHLLWFDVWTGPFWTIIDVSIFSFLGLKHKRFQAIFDFKTKHETVKCVSPAQGCGQPQSDKQGHQNQSSTSYNQRFWNLPICMTVKEELCRMRLFLKLYFVCVRYIREHDVVEMMILASTDKCPCLTYNLALRSNTCEQYDNTEKIMSFGTRKAHIINCKSIQSSILPHAANTMGFQILPIVCLSLVRKL